MDYDDLWKILSHFTPLPRLGVPEGDDEETEISSVWTSSQLL